VKVRYGNPVAATRKRLFQQHTHPDILTVYATLDTDSPNHMAPAAIGSHSSSTTTSATDTGNLIVVTEPCFPLDKWLQKHRPAPELIAWGLESIVLVLNFLHASLVHRCFT
jgi:hypothetical protein